jgi:hypothetical protein
VLPDEASGQSPGTLASFARRNDFSREGGKAVTVQGGYGTCFCNHGTNFIEHWQCRGTSLISGRKLVTVLLFLLTALAQCRGTNWIGARILSRYRIFIACR